MLPHDSISIDQSIFCRSLRLFFDPAGVTKMFCFHGDSLSLVWVQCESSWQLLFPIRCGRCPFPRVADSHPTRESRARSVPSPVPGKALRRIHQQDIFLLWFAAAAVPTNSAAMAQCLNRRWKWIGSALRRPWRAYNQSTKGDDRRFCPCNACRRLAQASPTHLA